MAQDAQPKHVGISSHVGAEKRSSDGGKGREKGGVPEGIGRLCTETQTAAPVQTAIWRLLRSSIFEPQQLDGHGMGPL